VGSFDPNPPGALTADRDPPGFDAVALALAVSEDEQQRHQAEASAARERRKLEEHRAKKQAERERLETTLRAAKREADALTHKISRLRTDLAAAEELFAKEQSRIDDLERRLAELEADG
jgi:septal ring factor EnvC (AmiA/AmiB activator)